MAIAYLGVGSNLGDRYGYLNDAICLLEQKNIRIQKHSTIMETEPEGGPPNQNKYLNAVVEIHTELSPRQLLRHLKDIERYLGRKPAVRNGPRTIDIDILLYEHHMIQSEQLTIPHPRMFKREFVMQPLKEIAPDVVDRFLHAHN